MEFESGDLAICVTCGTQYDAPLSSPPKSCRICDDPRQYVPPTGQSWTSLNESKAQQKNQISTDFADSRIHYITTTPLYPPSATVPPSLSDIITVRKQLGIGERAILLQTPSGNVLWDLIAYIDEETVDFIKAKGGLKAIVISHPHFYTTHLEWARIFGCPVYTSKDDEEWLNRDDTVGVRKLISGTTKIEEVQDVTAIQAGGHFDGSLFLHWNDGSGKGKLFIADTMMSAPSGIYHKDRPAGTITFSFMYSYPNNIPLPPEKIHSIWKALKPFEFESTYGGFEGQNVTRPDLKAQVLESAKIYLKNAGHENAAIFKETL